MKKVLGIILIGVLCLTIVGCGKKTNNNNTDTNNDSNNRNSETFEYGQNYIDNHLQGDYWIIYNLTNYQDGENDVTTIEIRRTAEGYYFLSDGSEGLFIKNGDSYDMYNGYDGEFEKSEIPMQSEYVEAMMNAYTMYMTSYVGYSQALNKIGTDNVAGRSCDKFAMDFTYPVYNYKYKYNYCIDSATGVGLRFIIELSGSGQKMGYEFEATKFQTDNVELPPY